MKILFIYPVPEARYQILRFQQGIGSIAAVLKQAGHGVELLIVSAMDTTSVDETIRRFQPGLIAMSLTSGFFPVGAAVARHVAATHRLPVLLGGIHPTLCPEESVSAEGVTAICVGEGEYPTLEFCEALEKGRDPTGIANLWFKRGDQIIRNPIRPLIQDLDSLPFPDRDIFPFSQMLNTFSEAEFMGSRGCPFPCTYCANHALQELYQGKGAYVRYRSVGNLLAEVDRVIRKYPGVGLLGFHDDTFTLNARWFNEFTETYPTRFRLPFWCNATAPSINEDVAARLKRAGCYEVRIGVESGNDDIRTRILAKKVSREQIVRAFRILKDAGITRFAFNMVGLPFETPATVEDTIALNHEIRPDSVFCSVFFPYPGTQSRKLCLEKGWVTDKTVDSYFSGEYALNQPTITAAQIRYYSDIFIAVIRHPHWSPVIRLLAHIPVTRTKTLWNAFRRVAAKCEWVRLTVRGLFLKPAPPVPPLPPLEKN